MDANSIAVSETDKSPGENNKGTVDLVAPDDSKINSGEIQTEGHIYKKCDGDDGNKINEGSSNDKTDPGQEDKPDEDVPEDFFDDFLKEDFMAGLDIVDEDNDPGPEVTNQNDRKSEVSSARMMKRRESKKLQKGKIDHVKRFREAPPEESFSKHPKKVKKKVKYDSELQMLDKELDEIRNAPLKKSEKSGVDADIFDIRRDPEKTRQAIQRDKIKSAKDKEKRLITDIVQTGLVPPGMELEVDINEVCQTEKQEPISDLREKLRSRKTRSKSVDIQKSSVKKRSPRTKRSPDSTKRRRSRSPKTATANSNRKSQEQAQEAKRNRSPLRRSPISRRSPLLRRRSPIMRRSPLLIRSSQLHQSHLSPSRRIVRSPKRSPIRRRTRSPRRSPPFRRRSRSRSLTNRRSPIFRSRSRDRSTSFRKRRDHSYSPQDKGRRRRTRSRTPKKSKKEEKVSFLEELVAKLNETHPIQSNLSHIAPPMNYLVPNIAPIVTPIPPIAQPQPQPMPVTYYAPPPIPQPPPVVQKYDPYDESFFIGTPAPITMPQSSQFGKEGAPQVDPPTGRSTQANGFQRFEADLSAERDVSKLFGDKRIKLSDFLAITAKPQVSNESTAKLQEKIKVIQRCQDAIKVLNERRFTGPLVVHKTDSYQYSKDMTISPLLRKPIVQLPFTTPGMKSSIEMDFTRCCETLLYRVGVEKKVVIPKNHEKNNIPPKEVTSKDTIPLNLPSKKFSEPSASLKVITKSLSTQTDKELSSCKECLRRKGTLYANCGIQAGDPMLTFSVSTQVTEADFYSMIPRTQSLASLTPAQLLGKQSMIVDPNQLRANTNRNFVSHDTSGRGRHIPSPPPPPTFHFPSTQSLSLQNDSPYPPPLFSQSMMPPSLLQNRGPIPPSKTYTDDRRGGFIKRF